MRIYKDKTIYTANINTANINNLSALNANIQNLNVSGIITSINGNSNPSQIINIGLSGLSPNIVSSLGTTTINIPRASATASGIITTGSQSFSGNKTFLNNLTVSGIFTASGIIKKINGNSTLHKL